ncbi:hypothetical protein E6C67_29950 [Azospirillum sp. TSA2s]|uniref:hypothetical protein n=1 Tax=Azospirillum sp. TSA2s TaxID=709810 RepID=UPI0010AB3B9A|nr:hypothetical protein [Azospirillum sp. TSA2s]QCG97933.1 hypothetical protein E6C67_29950 [Azospirillum sp. TSA2s]
MSGCNAQATPMPPHRTALHGQSHGQTHCRAARRLPADGHRRPATERCAHHSGCMPGAAQVAAQIAAHGGAPLWRMMMERWLAAAP